jgi:hypothetical protein
MPFHPQNGAAAGDDHKALRRVARALLNQAYNGNVVAAAMIADRLDGKVPQPRGGSEELGPQRLHVSWRRETQPNCTLAAATQDVIEINERDPRVRCAGPQQARAAQEADAKEP